MQRVLLAGLQQGSLGLLGVMVKRANGTKMMSMAAWSMESHGVGRTSLAPNEHEANLMGREGSAAATTP